MAHPSTSTITTASSSSLRSSRRGSGKRRRALQRFAAAFRRAPAPADRTDQPDRAARDMRPGGFDLRLARFRDDRRGAARPGAERAAAAGSAGSSDGSFDARSPTFERSFPDAPVAAERAAAAAGAGGGGGGGGEDATWVVKRAANYSFSGAPGADAGRDDDYVEFMGRRDFLRGRRQPRYISFDGVDVNDVDLSAPPPRRRYSRRWSDLVAPPAAL